MQITRRQVLAGGAAIAAGTVVSPLRAQSAPTIRFGHIVDESGVLKGVAGPSVVSADMAVARLNAGGGINGLKVELVRYDPGSDPRQAAVAARKLIEDDKVHAIIGPFSSGEVLVAMNDAERAKITMIPVAASQPNLLDGKEFLWRLVQDEGLQFRRVLNSLKRKGAPITSLETIYVSDEPVSNNAGTKTWPPILDEFGIKHGTPIAFQYKSFDLAPQVAKAMESKPDAIAVAATPDSAAKVVHELHRQGFKGHVTGSQLFADPNILDLFGSDGDGTIFAAGFFKGSSPEATAFDKDFLEGCKAKGIQKLGAFHTDAITYDVVNLLAQCVTRAKVTGAPAKLAEERLAINAQMRGVTFDGLLGKGICFKGPDARLPGYVIDMERDSWTLYDTWPADSCA